MKKVLIVLIINLSVILFSETSGEYGFQMLKISSGANVAAQGGAGAFSSNDAFGFLQNPTAGLLSRNNVLSLTQNYWIFDTTINSGAYLNSKGKTSFGFAYRYLDYGKIDQRLDSGELIGEFHPMDLVLSINFGYRVTPDHYVGLNINALYEKIDTSSSYGFTFDLGYTYLTPFKDLKFSAALKHFGKTSEMDQDVIDIPFTGEIALIKDMNFFTVDFSTELKAIKHIDDDELKGVCGIRADINKTFNLKFGYKFNYDAEDISAGFGVNLNRISFDYAFVPFNYEIDDVHIMGITYKF
ncbi:MAG: PorV/PorQ family protein [Candidatus Cloacimonetes bacterium]|nr:PorV/PorQ family protein [Candidatus Cloacimonadota bacterium]